MTREEVFSEITDALEDLHRAARKAQQNGYAVSVKLEYANTKFDQSRSVDIRAPYTGFGMEERSPEIAGGPLSPHAKCSVDGCDRQKKIRGMCPMHYQREYHLARKEREEGVAA